MRRARGMCLFYIGRVGEELTEEVTSQQRSKEERDSHVAFGGRNSPLKENHQCKRIEWRECMEGSRRVRRPVWLEQSEIGRK